MLHGLRGFSPLSCHQERDLTVRQKILVNNTLLVSVGGGFQTLRVLLCYWGAPCDWVGIAGVLLWPYPNLTPIKLVTGAGAGYGRNILHPRLNPSGLSP